MASAALACGWGSLSVRTESVAQRGGVNTRKSSFTKTKLSRQRRVRHLAEKPIADHCGRHRRHRLHSEGCRGGFEGGQVIFGICRSCRVEQKATRATRGAISLSSSSHLPASEPSIIVKPV